MKEAIPGFDPFDIEVRHLRKLKDAWEFKYPSLKSENEINLVENYDTGRIWAGQFIAGCIKSVVAHRKLTDQAVAYNWQAKERHDLAAQKAAEREEFFAGLRALR